ncbi:hypothetical protein JCM15765_32790 [Paradesulfitobacterium aromaticivorans]
MKKLLLLFMVLVILFTPVVALGESKSVYSGSIVQPLSYQNLAGGYSQLIDNGDGTITISGYTSTYNSVSEIGLTLKLQYYANGNWYTLQTFSYSDKNTSYVSGGQHLSVSRGYTYRVAAEHTALSYSNTYESGYSYTNAVYIP